MKDDLAGISKDQILVLSQISLAMTKRFNVTTSVFPGVKERNKTYVTGYPHSILKHNPLT